MKCKPIDRLALTRKRFPHIYGDEKEIQQATHREGYSICPNCGQETLIHEDGCMKCMSCGWSACG